MRPILIALACAAVAVPAMARDIPAATVAGKPVDCLPLPQIRETRVRDDRTIDFITNGRKVYRNTLPYACSGLGFEESFGYETSIGQLCSTDIITVLYHNPVSRGPSCGLGKFQPVTLAR